MTMDYRVSYAPPVTPEKQKTPTQRVVPNAKPASQSFHNASIFTLVARF